MPPVSQIAGLLLTLSVSVLSVPFPLTELYKGRLLGSSFGVPGIELTYDYVIVGGGNAGLTIAARLAEHASVAVIEAGGFYEMGNGNISQIAQDDIFWADKDRNDTNPLIDWGFQTTSQAVSVCIIECPNGS
jgi:choline dehydrogenase